MEFSFLVLELLVLMLAMILMVKMGTANKVRIPPFPVTPFLLIGHLLHLKKEPRAKMKDWAERVGDIFSIYFGPKLVVVLNSYDVIKEVLVKQADYFGDMPTCFIGDLKKDGYKGLIAASRSGWKEQRSVCMAVPRAFGMGKNTLARKIHEEVDVYLCELSILKGEPSNVRILTNACVLNVICSFIVGKRFEFDDPYFLKLLHIFNDQTQLLTGTSFLNLVSFFPWLRFLPGDFFNVRRVIHNANSLTHFCSDYIKLFFKPLDADDENGEANLFTDYLTEMRRERHNGESITMDEEDDLQRVMGDLFIAASQTSITLLWFFLYMIHYPDVQERIYKEIIKNVGTDRAPSMHDKHDLKYLQATIMETQRIAGIVPYSLPHLCTADISIRDYTIPKGAIVLPNLDNVLLDKKRWGDPLNFRPEKFLGQDGSLLRSEEFIPFSLGRQSCLSKSLSEVELFLFPSAIIQRFEAVPEDAGALPPLREVSGKTTYPEAYRPRFVERRM